MESMTSRVCRLKISTAWPASSIFPSKAPLTTSSVPRFRLPGSASPRVPPRLSRTAGVRRPGRARRRGLGAPAVLRPVRPLLPGEPLRGHRGRGLPDRRAGGGGELRPAPRRGSAAAWLARLRHDLLRVVQPALRVLPELGHQPEGGGTRGQPRRAGRDDARPAGAWAATTSTWSRPATSWRRSSPPSRSPPVSGLHLPLVYNTGGYDSLEALALLDGVVDIYMPDMKYADAAVAHRYSHVRDYWEVNTAAVKEMHRQVGDLVLDDQRHRAARPAGPPPGPARGSRRHRARGRVPGARDLAGDLPEPDGPVPPVLSGRGAPAAGSTAHGGGVPNRLGGRAPRGSAPPGRVRSRQWRTLSRGAEGRLLRSSVGIQIAAVSSP